MALAVVAGSSIWARWTTATISAEIVVAQLGKAVEAEPLDDERVEMPGEEVGQIERSGLLFGERVECLPAGVKGVAMGAVDPPYAFFREHPVERAARAAIAVEAEDLVVGRAVGADLRPHRLGNALGAVVQARRQAGEIDRIEFQRKNLARQRAAGDDENFPRAVCPARVGGLGVNVFGCERHVTVEK